MCRTLPHSLSHVILIILKSRYYLFPSTFYHKKIHIWKWQNFTVNLHLSMTKSHWPCPILALSLFLHPSSFPSINPYFWCITKLQTSIHIPFLSNTSVESIFEFLQSAFHCERGLLLFLPDCWAELHHECFLLALGRPHPSTQNSCISFPSPPSPPSCPCLFLWLFSCFLNH